MDINFTGNDHLISQSTIATAALKCDNCSSWYQKDLQLQDANVEKLGSTSLGTEALIWDALAFIYGVSWTSIKNYNLKKKSDFLKNPDNLRFCYNCIGLLNDNYNSHLKFEQSSDSSSVVQLLKGFRDYQISSSEKQIDVQFLSNNLVAAVDRDIKVDLDEDFLLEDSEEDPFQTSDGVEIKYEPESTYTEYFSDQNISEQSRSRGSPGLKRLRSRQLVIKTEKLSPEEILRFSNKSNREKKRGKPKKRKRLTAVKNLGIFLNSSDPSVAEIVKLTEKSPLEKKIITAASNSRSRPHRTKAMTKKKKLNPGLSFEEKVQLVMEKYKESTKCPRISLKGQFICNVCGKGFKNFDHLRRRHWPIHHEDTTVCVCDICGKSVKRYYMKEHKVRAHTTEEEQNKYKSKCNLCDEIVFSFTMSDHLRIKHYKLSEVECNQCGKVFASNTRLKTHLTEVHSTVSEKCDLCDKVFKSTKYLKNHKIKVHGNRERKFCCEICPYKVCTKSELETHKIVHTNTRQYVCDECGKTFKYVSHFRRHMRCHKEIAEKGEGSVKCNLCGGKKFKHSLSLGKHIARVHPKGKKRIYECSVCCKRLCSAFNLRVHENMHKENPGFVPRVRTKLPQHIIHGHHSNDKLKDSSQIQPIL